MKKVIAFILLATLILGLCGCAAKQDNQTEQKKGVFQAGFGRSVITPINSVPLSGFSNEKYRYSNELGSDICATAVAVTDEQDTTFILIEMDLVKIYDYFVNEVREKINAATGVPQENIMVSASHTHASVAAFVNFDIYIQNEYLPWMTEQTIQAGIDAYNDRSEAKLYMGEIETEGMNFVRHYSFVDDDGVIQYSSDNYGTFKLTDTTKHMKDADPTLYLLQFKRDGAKDIILGNWRAHPHFQDGSTAYMLTSDFPGYWRDCMEYAMDCNFVFFQAAAGNINAQSRIKTEMKATEVNAYAYEMTKYSQECLNKNMVEVTNHTIQLRHTDLVEQCNHSEDSKLPLAQQVTEYFSANNGNVSATATFAQSIGLHSYYHATSIISKSKLGETQTEPFDAIAIGTQLAMVFAPNELFDTNSEWLESVSPYDKTLTMGYSNVYGSYMPAAEAFEYGCYEVDVTRGAKGTAELIQENFLSMLNDMHG